MSEMLDNPLYGSVTKSHSQAKDQGHPPTDRLTPAADGDPDRPPLPVPRNRSFTFTENKPQPCAAASLQPPSQKKPVVPSRSEGGMVQCRPPLPKQRPEAQNPKPRDYRDCSELPCKQRLPARLSPLPPHKDSKEHPQSSGLFQLNDV